MREEPFSHLEKLLSTRWINLALLVVFLLYIALSVFVLSFGDMCQHVAYDYCAFWSVGKVINNYGLGKIYDLGLLEQIQSNIYLRDSTLSNEFVACPVPYLPIFIVPFKFLSLISLPYSFAIWTLINLIVFQLYLCYFTKKVFGFTPPIKLLLLFLISFPVFVNFSTGQNNIFLLICAGEMFRSLKSDRPYIAGLWLGGWLLKPQLLLLILIFLLIHRSIKTLAGFFTSFLAVTILSLSLTNTESFMRLKDILFEYSEGNPTNNIQAMMNWRMLGWHLETISSSILSWAIVIIGSFLTIFVTFYVFREKKSYDSRGFTIAILGIFAATGVVTWHSHTHMAIILIPPMLYLLITNQFNEKIFLAWVFVPIFTQFIGYISAFFIEFENLSANIPQVVWFSRGFPEFILNLTLLGWAMIQFKKITNKGSLLRNANDA